MKAIKFSPKYEIGTKVFYWNNEENVVESSIVSKIAYWIDGNNNEITFQYYLANKEKKWEEELSLYSQEIVVNSLIDRGFMENIFKMPTKEEIETVSRKVFEEMKEDCKDIHDSNRIFLLLESAGFAKAFSRRVYKKLKEKIINKEAK